ncbi:uncharacterized protein LOC116145805 [Pistacia vera]|uniref:uncharacterized protein LOC116145805 n=1 Tax=Pistacia vera TaxID=55513 RepID=UPI001263199E|nr:uncharacterized protein LOC116145805 [Pistacia vera]
MAEPGPYTLTKVCASVRCVVVVVSGRPVTIEPWMHQIDALLQHGCRALKVRALLMFCLEIMGSLGSSSYMVPDYGSASMNVGDPKYDPISHLGLDTTEGSRQLEILFCW